MKTFVISTFSLFNNELLSEIIKDESEIKALKRSSLVHNLIGEVSDTDSTEGLKQEALNCDGGLNIIEIP